MKLYLWRQCMIEFRSVSWKNFLSTGNAATKIDLTAHSTTLITGENGAGKSTILDALCFGLYGKPFRKVKKNQLINSVNNGSTVVEIEFFTNGREYKITRGIKPAILQVYENGHEKDQAANVRDFQEDIEKNILRMNMKSFTQTVILGSSSFIPFMQLSTHVRREVIEDLLDIGVFSTMSALLKDKTTSNKQDLAMNDKDIHGLDSMIDMQKEQSKFDQERRKVEIERCETRIREIDENTEIIDSQIEEINYHLNELYEQISDETKVHKKSDRILKLETDLDKKKKNAFKVIDFYNNNDNCPTCTQQISDEIKQEKIKERTDVIAELDSGILKLTEEIEKINVRTSEIKKIRREIQSKEVDLTKNNQLKTADDRERTLLFGKIKDLNNEEFTHTADKLLELNKEKEERLAEKESLLNKRQLLEIATLILKDSGIKAKIIKQYVPIINQLVNKYLAAMDFFVKFELDENFSEKILSRHRDDFSYDSFSEGEKMRIDLSLLFTWRTIAKMKNSASTNLLILDEVFDASLDTNGCDEFLKILEKLESSNVFVISHKADIMQDKFENHIRFEKYKNFSRIAA